VFRNILLRSQTPPRPALGESLIDDHDVRLVDGVRNEEIDVALGGPESCHPRLRALRPGRASSIVCRTFCIGYFFVFFTNSFYLGWNLLCRLCVEFSAFICSKF